MFFLGSIHDLLQHAFVAQLNRFSKNQPELVSREVEAIKKQISEIKPTQFEFIQMYHKFYMTMVAKMWYLRSHTNNDERLKCCKSIT